MDHVKKRLSPGTVILGDSENAAAGGDNTFIEVGFTKIATEIGNKVYSNIVAVGTLAAMFDIDLDTVKTFIGRHFSAKNEKIINENIHAAEAGFKEGVELVTSGKLKIEIERDESVSGQIVVSGAEAVGLGAIASGCNFIS